MNAKTVELEDKNEDGMVEKKKKRLNPTLSKVKMKEFH